MGKTKCWTCFDKGWIQVMMDDDRYEKDLCPDCRNKKESETNG